MLEVSRLVLKGRHCEAKSLRLCKLTYVHVKHVNTHFSRQRLYVVHNKIERTNQTNTELHLHPQTQQLSPLTASQSAFVFLALPCPLSVTLFLAPANSLPS